MGWVHKGATVARRTRYCIVDEVRTYLTHAAQEANGIAKSLKASEHQKRLLLQLSLVVFSGSEHQARTRCRSVVHDERLELREDTSGEA